MAVSRTNSVRASDLLVELERDGGDAAAPPARVGAARRDPLRAAAAPASRCRRRECSPPTSACRAASWSRRTQQLVAEGYLTSRSGGYTRVAMRADGDRPGGRRAADAAPLARRSVDFGYGRANVATFPRAAWLRSVRRVLTEAPDERLGYLDGRGVPELRDALADYLNRVRGTARGAGPRRDRERLRAGRSRCCSACSRPRGATRLAVEDPSANDDARPMADGGGPGGRRRAGRPRRPADRRARPGSRPTR